MKRQIQPYGHQEPPIRLSPRVRIAQTVQLYIRNEGTQLTHTNKWTAMYSLLSQFNRHTFFFRVPI